MGSKFAEKEIKEAVDLYYSGAMSQQEVCEALGYPSQPTLSRWLRDDPRHAPRAESGSGGEKGGRMSYSVFARIKIDTSLSWVSTLR